MSWDDHVLGDTNHVLGPSTFTDVVWNFVVLLCTLFFVRQLCVLAGHFCGAQKKTCINTKIVVWEHVLGVFLLILNIFDVCMLLEVVWNFVLLLCTLFFVRQLCMLAGHVCGT